MTPQVASALISGGISAGTSLLGGLSNARQSERWAQRNLDLQKSQFEYQKQLNNLQMSREDSAYQRAVSDAKAAGLSPLAVSGGASAGAMSSTAFSGVGNNAGQVDYSGIQSGLSNALSVYNAGLQREQQNNNNAQSKADIAFKLAQTQASNAQTAFLNNQSEAVSLDNAFKTSTMASRVSEAEGKAKYYDFLFREIESRTDLNKAEKEKLTSELNLLKIQEKTYADYLQEQLNSAKLANAEQTIKNDNLRIDRLFKNAELSVWDIDKRMNWHDKNKSLFNMLGLGNLQDLGAQLEFARRKQSDTAWFHEYGN